MQRLTQEEFVAKVKEVHGDKFTVKGTYRGRRKKVLIECLCGHQWSSLADDLLEGHGCLACFHRRPAHNRLDLAGQTFGRLLVIQEAGKDDHGQVKWLCNCQCGSKGVVVSATKLRGTPGTKSCGCLKRERLMELHKKNSNHGLHSHRLYQTWHGMMNRCINIHAASYKHYGAKGVTVCQDWLKVDNFIKDMGSAWKPGLSLDRRDASGPYSPENCRWIPRREQGFSENKRAYQEIQILKKELAEAKLLISALRTQLKKSQSATP
jgi:hypothetical protein